MKKKIFVLIISAILLATACKESTTEPQVETINDQYFVINDGASFNYNLTITDTTGFSVNGNRFMLFDDSTIIGGTKYKIQIDSFETFIPFDTLTTTSISYMRNSNTGVFSYADTTGFTSFLPDSLRQYVTVDREARVLFYPLAVNQIFPVYTLSLSATIIGINVLDIDASVVADEVLNLILNSVPVQKQSFKIKYVFVIRLSSTIEFQYEAYGWVVKDLGFVKWDGDSEVFNFLFNENIFPPETNVKMKLTQYSIP